MSGGRAFAAFLVVICSAPSSHLAAASGDADDRASLIHRAQVWTRARVARADLERGPGGPGAFGPGETVYCDYLDKKLDGHSQKFACRIGGDDEVKVKFGGTNGEVHGEVVATRLLWALGFGADRMYPVRVICRGCPSYVGPVYVGRNFSSGNDDGSGNGDGFGNGDARLVDPAVVERKFPGRELPRKDESGWSWQEIDLIDDRVGGATRAERDALKLLAVLMQHTDTKPEQQRLVCLDEGKAERDDTCQRPFMLINDLGLTFGRANLVNANAIGSVNFKAWAETPVWKGSAGCVGNLPKSLSGTLKDPPIGEDGRRLLADLLTEFSDAQLRDLFTVARVHLRTAPATMWPDASGVQSADAPAPVDEWVRTFKKKRAEIVERRCNDSWSASAPLTFETAPIVWLQSRATPPLTTAMNVISLLGYSGVYMAIAIILAFGYRLRAGAALLLLLALTTVIADAAKVAVSFPRPSAIDNRVEAFSLLQTSETPDTRHERAATTPDSLLQRIVSLVRRAVPGEASPQALDDGGFPSGHVASATVFFLGLIFFFNWRWAWTGLIAWVLVMALSRMYLGRHFLGDVLGGFGVGVIVTAMGLQALNLGRFSNPAIDAERAQRIARRVLIIAALLAACALALSVPDLRDASRFLGLAVGVMLLVRDARMWDAAPLRVRAARILLTAVLFPLAWWGVSRALNAVGEIHGPLPALISGSLPVAVLLAGPIYVGRALSATKSTKKSFSLEPRNTRNSRNTRNTRNH